MNSRELNREWNSIIGSTEFTEANGGLKSIQPRGVSFSSTHHISPRFLCIHWVDTYFLFRRWKLWNKNLTKLCIGMWLLHTATQYEGLPHRAMVCFLQSQCSWMFNFKHLGNYFSKIFNRLFLTKQNIFLKTIAFKL